MNSTGNFEEPITIAKCQVNIKMTTNSDKKYFDLENKFRGERSIIKKRLQIYKPILTALTNKFDDLFAVDIGCGRGEWLEFAKEEGFNILGIDKNIKMINYCLNKNLNVIDGDFLNVLSGLKENSVSILSCFHMIEHIKNNSLDALFFEAYRILQPGGLLLIETPNPENILVSTHNFYLDRDHIRPIPPQLLSYLADQHEFINNFIVRIDSAIECDNYNEKFKLLYKTLTSFPDYALIAEKQQHGEVSTLNCLRNIFEADNYFNNTLINTFYFLANELERIEKRDMVLNEELKKNLNDILTSSSWKVTKPLRVFNFYYKKCFSNFAKFFKRIFLH